MLTLKFDKRIYKLKAVRAAAREYSAFADFSINENGNNINVEIENIDFQPENVFLGEFSNYIIHKMGAKS